MIKENDIIIMNLKSNRSHTILKKLLNLIFKGFILNRGQSYKYNL